MVTYRPTKAIVNLEAVRENVRNVKEKVSPAKVMAVVKANAYGHGMTECAKAAFQAGASYFGVATVDEAIELRKTFAYPFPILVLGPIFPSDGEVIIENKIEVALGSIEVAQALNSASEKFNIPALVHLKIDTGMGRFGFWFEDILKHVEEIKNLTNVKIIGLMTHFSDSDSKDFTYTKWQLKNFKKAIKDIKKNGIEAGMIHAANSGAIHQHPASYFDMVRLGISLYGYYPSSECSRELKLSPALSLTTKIIKIRNIPKGRFLSYGKTFKTTRDSRIGILPIGYGDGFVRKNSNNGHVLVRGKKAQLIGRVCMDQILIDLTDISEAAEGDDVVLIGTQGSEIISMEDFAERIGTITYEVTCLLTKRLPREYIN